MKWAFFQLVEFQDCGNCNTKTKTNTRFRLKENIALTILIKTLILQIPIISNTQVRLQYHGRRNHL